MRDFVLLTILVGIILCSRIEHENHLLSFPDFWRGKKNGNQNRNKNGNKMYFGSGGNEFYGKSRVSFEVCFFSLVSENFIHEQ